MHRYTRGRSRPRSDVWDYFVDKAKMLHQEKSDRDSIAFATEREIQQKRDSIAQDLYYQKMKRQLSTRG